MTIIGDNQFHLILCLQMLIVSVPHLGWNWNKYFLFYLLNVHDEICKLCFMIISERIGVQPKCLTIHLKHMLSKVL